MKKVTLVLSIFILALLVVSCSTIKLSIFGAEMGVQSNPIPGMDDIRIPYTSTVKYFGYVKPGEEADEMIDGKKVYYLYVWIPAVAPEIGVRMLSPTTGYVEPEEGDIVAAGYMENVGSDGEAFFDTWINFERALTVINPEDILQNANNSDWISFNTNDDSSEMPSQPSGSSYNSLMRVESGDIPIVRGLYRIGFTTYKVGEVKGSFYAEIGAPIELPGVVIAKTLEDLVLQVQ